MTLKLQISGTPDEVAAFTAYMRTLEPVVIEDASEIIGYGTSQWTKQYVRLTCTAKVAMPEPPKVQRREPRQRRQSTGTGKRQPKTKAGYVYLVQEVNGTHYKIGKAVNPKSRRRTFDVKLPFRIELLHTIQHEDMHLLEKSLHHHFREKRAGGEFFQLTAEDVAFFRALAPGLPIIQKLIEVYQNAKRRR